MKAYPRHTIDFKIDDLLKSKKLNHQQFEKDLSKMFNKEVLHLPSLRYGLFCCLEYFDLQGKRVGISRYTYSPVAQLLESFGCKVIYIEPEIDSFNISLKEVKNKELDALVVSHLFGSDADIINIERYCKKNDIILIEDTAHSFGTTCQGRLLGTFGDAGLFSFGLGKSINLMGGGVLISSNKDLINFSSRLSQDLKKKPKYISIAEVSKTYILNKLTNGFLFKLFTLRVIKALNHWTARTEKMSDKILEGRKNCLGTITKAYAPSKTQARLGVHLLRSFKNRQEHLKTLHDLYIKELSDVRGLRLQKVSKETIKSHSYFFIRTSHSISLQRKLLKDGIDTKLSDMHDCLNQEGSIAQTLQSTCLELPMNYTMNLDDIKYISKKVKEYFN